MMRFIIILSLLFIFGCGQSPKIELVPKTTYVPVTLPDILLQACHVTRPPDVDNYLKKDCDGKENALTNYTISLLTDLKQCNDQIEQIKNINSNIIKLHSDAETGDKQ